MTVESNTERPIRAEHVQAGNLHSYLARPTEGENLPAVLIIHEIFGLNDNIRDIARRFAREGYAALAVDLYSRSTPRALCITRVVFNLMRDPLGSFSVYDMDGAIKFLQEQPGVDREQVGVIGFCMGGGFALAMAVHNQEVRAASVFYGRNPNPITALEKACPVVGSYGANDPIFSKVGQKTEQVMKGFGRPVDVKIYPGAGHSFFNDTGKAYRPEAAADSWQRTLGWFEEYLPKKV